MKVDTVSLRLPRVTPSAPCHSERSEESLPLLQEEVRGRSYRFLNWDGQDFGRILRIGCDADRGGYDEGVPIIVHHFNHSHHSSQTEIPRSARNDMVLRSE